MYVFFLKMWGFNCFSFLGTEVHILRRIEFFTYLVDLLEYVLYLKVKVCLDEKVLAFSSFAILSVASNVKSLFGWGLFSSYC